MGGMVVLAIRQNGRTTTRLVPKYQGIMPTFASFATGTYRKDPWFADDWKKASNVPLAPDSYGLVVVDHDTRWVGSCSNYSGQHESMFRQDRERDIEELITLHGQGRVESCGLANTSGPDVPMKLPPKALTVDDLKRAIRKAGGNPEHATVFAELAPPQGWEFDDYATDDADDWTAFLDQLEARGIIRPTAELLTAWEQHMESLALDQNPMAAWRSRFEAETIDQATKPASQHPKKRRL